MIQATSTLIVSDFHCSLCSIFILQKYISLTLIIVCVCFLLIIDLPSFYLLVSYLLIQFMHHHYCHQRMLITEKCGFLFNKSSQTCKTSHYLNDVTCHLSYYIYPTHCITDFCQHASYLVIYSVGIFQGKKK